MLFGGITLPGHPSPENIRRLDLLPLEQVRRMQRVGIAIDKDWLRDLSSRLELRKDELRKDISSFIPPDSLELFVSESGDNLTLNVDSAEQIAQLLFKVLGVGRGRRLKSTRSGKRISTGKKQLETLKRDHPAIPKILEYREASKLKSTYTDALPDQARLHNRGECIVCGLQHLADHWRIHGQITTTRTSTGRLAMKKPNLQNIPVRTALGREVRKAFVAQPGKKLVAADYSQIELRLLADRARERNMIRVFSNDGDIHLETAMRAFDISDPKRVDKLTQRDPSKNVNFAIAYGLSPPGLYDLMAVTYAVSGLALPGWLTLEWCAAFIEKWFDLYPEAKEYFELQHYRARRYEIVWDMFGRVRRIPEVRSVHERVRAAGLREAGNMPIQGGAAGVFKLGAARVEQRLEMLRAQGIGTEALVPVHDELVCEVDEDWAEEVAEIVKAAMENALTDEQTGEVLCRVPVKVDVKAMEKWEK